MPNLLAVSALSNPPVIFLTRSYRKGFVHMTEVTPALGLAIIVSVTACSGDAAKRTAYETLQNIGQQECLEDMSSDCQSRESYDDYQRQRKELVPPAN
jgi:hypothetical protein